MQIAADNIAKAALAPIVIAQGLAARRRARVLPEADGPRAGEAGQGPLLRLLILGDSSAAGVGVANQDQALSGQLVARLAPDRRVRWRVVAQSGATTRDALAMLVDAAPERFDIAVVALGVNDVTHGVTLNRWLERQRALVDLLGQRFGVRHSLLSGLPPMGRFPALPQPLRRIMGAHATRFDRARAAAFAGDARVTHMPFDISLTPAMMAQDGYHPGPLGYALWADRVAPRIVRNATA